MNGWPSYSDVSTKCNTARPSASVMTSPVPYPESTLDNRVPPSSRIVDFIEYLLRDSSNVDVALT